VLVATIVFAVYLWGCDVVFYKAIDFLFTRFGVST
jgi:preprotein translocase subunit SecE